MAVDKDTILSDFKYYVLGKPKVSNISREFTKHVVINGTGTLSGAFPNGLVTENNEVTVAKIRVFIRSFDTDYNGLQVAETMSANDGTWIVTGLSTDFRYDVIASKDGYNDIIVSDVSPMV